MFTGIIEAVGRVRAIEQRGGDLRLLLDTGEMDLSSSRLGDSIACNGVCLTAVELSAKGYAADVSRETLEHTSLGGLKVGARVNLERALTLATPLGGHLVSGHVDGLGEVLSRREDARSLRLRIEAPAELARYIAARGSICIDGVSLTVNRIDGRVFDLNIVPHTARHTIITDYAAGQRVNLEVDLIARYLERLLLDQRREPSHGTGGITLDLLARSGMLRGGA